MCSIIHIFVAALSGLPPIPSDAVQICSVDTVQAQPITDDLGISRQGGWITSDYFGTYSYFDNLNCQKLIPSPPPGNEQYLVLHMWYLVCMGRGVLVFWESWQDRVVNCEEMKLCKILGLNVKLKNDESKILPIMTVKWEEKVLKCEECEVRLSRSGPPYIQSE